jgi:endonuclease YncB( thermonuclease family)
MFWFLHYSVKAVIALGIVGIGVVLYINRHWFTPADEWVETMRRVKTEPLPVLGVTTGRVVRVPTGDTVVIQPDAGPPQNFRIAGITVPPYSRNPLSDEARVHRETRDYLSRLALSNDVRVAYTFLAPGELGGIGGAYLESTNLAVPLLASGMAIVHDGSLKGLPVIQQVLLLAAEKEAREAGRGLWTNAAALEAMRNLP